MNNEQSRINWIAVAGAVAIALTLTLGVPAAMDARNAPDSYLSTLAAVNVAPRTEVSIEPQRIDVIAVRERPTLHGFWLASQKRAG